MWMWLGGFSMWIWFCCFKSLRYRGHDLCKDPALENIILHMQLEAAGHDVQANGSKSPQQHLVHGLAKVQASTAWDGPLTAWPKELFALHKYMGKPADAFALEVVEAHPLAEPVELHSQMIRGKEVDLKATAKDFLFWPTSPGAVEECILDSATPPRSAGQFLLQRNNNTTRIRGIQGPACYINLAASGRLNTLLWCHSWGSLGQPALAAGALAVPCPVPAPKWEDWETWEAMLNTLRAAAPAVEAMHGRQSPLWQAAQCMASQLEQAGQG